MLRFTFYDYPVVTSTNDQIKDLFNQGALEGTVVIAQQQTAGRGRRGRPWISEPGNIYLSLLLTPKCSLQEVHQLSFVMVLGVGRTIRSYLPDPQMLAYKWPNDLLVGGAKICGILIEIESQANQVADACIIGMGINVNTQPSEVTYPTTALKNHTIQTIDRHKFIADLLENIRILYETWQKDGFDPIGQEWTQSAYGIRKNMRIQMNAEEIHGQFEGINSAGALILKDDKGELHEYMSGEIQSFFED